MKRIDCIKFIAEKRTNELLLTSVGGVAHEQYAVDDRPTNLCMVQMSYTTPMALGIATGIPHRKVIVLEGDGSLLMNLGVLATVAARNPKNLLIVCFDNERYFGPGMPTHTAGKADLATIARGAGFETAVTVRDIEAFRKTFTDALSANQLALVVAKTEADPSIPPDILPYDLTENTYIFMRELVRQKLTQAWRELYPSHFGLK